MGAGTALGDGGNREDRVEKRILSVPVMQHRNGKVQQQIDDDQPDHLLILVHGILSKYVH